MYVDLGKIKGQHLHTVKLHLAKQMIEREKLAGGVINLDAVLDEINTTYKLVPQERIGQFKKEISALKEYYSCGPTLEIDRYGYTLLKAANAVDKVKKQMKAVAEIVSKANSNPEAQQ